MSDLTRLAAEGLLDDCPMRIITGNWDAEWQEVKRRVRRLEKCEAEHAADIVQLVREKNRAVKAVQKRLEKYDAALKQLAMDLGPIGKIARSALEE